MTADNIIIFALLLLLLSNGVINLTQLLITLSLLSTFTTFPSLNRNNSSDCDCQNA